MLTKIKNLLFKKGLKVKVIERDDKFLRIYNLTGEKDGLIYYDKKEYPKEDVTELYDHNRVYYLVGALDPSEVDNLKVAAKVFRNKFFKSLLKDRFSFTEYMLLVLTVASLAFMYVIYTQLQVFWEYVGV